MNIEEKINNLEQRIKKLEQKEKNRKILSVITGITSLLLLL